MLKGVGGDQEWLSSLPARVSATAVQVASDKADSKRLYVTVDRAWFSSLGDVDRTTISKVLRACALIMRDGQAMDENLVDID